jgi:hypothetical protein
LCSDHITRKNKHNKEGCFFHIAIDISVA